MVVDHCSDKDLAAIKEITQEIIYLQRRLLHAYNRKWRMEEELGLKHQQARSIIDDENTLKWN